MNEYLNNNYALTTRSKIIVDGIEYLGDVIKTTPKFSHTNETYIGGFPSKTVSFEMLNFNNDIDFLGKELSIYRGILIDKDIQWVKQGVFIPIASNIETNINARTISFKEVRDKTQLLDDIYESDLDWSVQHTGLEIVQEICTKKNLVLATLNFHFAKYLFNRPNIPSKATNREVISRIAQIGGEIAIFNSDGQIAIKSQNFIDDEIPRKRYGKVSREKIFTPNVLVIGNEGYDNDIMYPSELPNNPVEIKIEDNPFIDLERIEMIEEVAKYVLNVNYIPFQIENFVDGFGYELNDVIDVIDKDGNHFNAVILEYKTTSKIKSSIGAPNKENVLSKYNLAGSNKQSINEVKFEVNHINNTIKSLISNIDGNTEQISQIIQELESILFSIQNSGGNNLIKNSVGFAGTTEWNLAYDSEDTSTVNCIASTQLLEKGSSGGAFALSGVKISQSMIVSPNITYSFSCIVKKMTETGYIKVYNANNESQCWLKEFSVTENPDYEKFEFNDISITGNTLVVEAYGAENSGFTITDMMLNKGDMPMVWTQANGEILNTQVNINLNGVIVKSVKFDETGQYTVISPLEFAGYALKNGVSTRVFTVNGDTTEVDKLRATSMIAMKPLKIVARNTGTNKGWAIVQDSGGNS